MQTVPADGRVVNPGVIGWIERPHREQARSHRFFVVHKIHVRPDPLWERACSRWL